MATHFDRKTFRIECLTAVCVALLTGWLRIWWTNAYLREIPYAGHPLNDARMYWEMGRTIYQQGWLLAGEGPFYQAPLYSYFLAMLHHLGFHRIHSVIHCQTALGIGSVLLCYALARFRLPVGWAASAALLFGFSHYSFFYETKLLATSLGMFLFLLFALTFAFWLQSLPKTFEAIRREGGKIHWLLLSGSALLYSLAVLCRPNLLFTLPLLLLLIAYAQNLSVRRAAIFLIVCVLGIAPVTLRNYLVGGGFIPLCANSGVTLYMGNNSEAQGGLAPVKGLSSDIADQKEGSVALASKLAGLDLTVSQASNFWVWKTVAWAVSNPGDFLVLEGKKLLWALYHSPPAVNYSAHFESRFLPVLTVLKYVTWLSLFGSLLGLPFLMAGRDRMALFLVSLFAGYLLLSLVYYSSDRFLASIIPFTSIAALWTTRIVFQRWKNEGAGWTNRLNYRVVCRAFLWIAVVAMLTANPFLGWNAERETGMGWYILGLFHSERGDETPALTCYEQAQDLIPDYPSLLLNLGVLYGKQGDLERSTRLFERVLILDPGNRTAHDNLEINHRRMQIPPQ